MSSVNVNERLEEIFVVWMFDAVNSGGDGLVLILQLGPEAGVHVWL